MDAMGFPRPPAVSPSQTFPLCISPHLWNPLVVWEGETTGGPRFLYARHSLASLIARSSLQKALRLRAHRQGRPHQCAGNPDRDGAFGVRAGADRQLRVRLQSAPVVRFPVKGALCRRRQQFDLRL